MITIHITPKQHEDLSQWYMEFEFLNGRLSVTTEFYDIAKTSVRDWYTLYIKDHTITNKSFTITSNNDVIIISSLAYDSSITKVVVPKKDFFDSFNTALFVANGRGYPIAK